MSDEVAEGLRVWAEGVVTDEAAVLLLTTVFGGRFASAGYPWVRRRTEGGAGWWLDASQITPDAIGVYSGGEQRVLRLAGSLAGGAPVSLADDLTGLDGSTG